MDKPTDSMTFEVAVVGAGITGATIAAALCEQGVRTALIDSGCCGSQGASRYSGGIMRLYDPDAAIMQLAALGLQCLEREGYGRAFDAAITRSGVLYTAPASTRAALEAAIGRHASARYPMRLLAPDEVRRISALADARAGRVHLFEPRAGAGDVRATVRAMARLVRERGGAVLENAAVGAIAQDSRGAIVHLQHGALRARVVVVAAGAWSARFVPELGIQTRSIPLVRLQASVAPAMPCIDTVAGTYAVPLHGRLVQVGSQIRSRAADPDALPKPSGVERADALIRLSDLSGRNEDGPVLDTMAAFDAYTRDERPVFGFMGHADARYVATGMSGIGYKLAPALAHLAARQIALRLGRDGAAPDPLAAQFSPARLHDAPPMHLVAH